MIEIESPVMADLKTHTAPELAAFASHTKCPASFTEGIRVDEIAGSSGFFNYAGLRLFGRNSAGSVAPKLIGELPNISADGLAENGSITLPFSPTEVVDNLRLEKYVQAVNSEIPYISNHKSASRRVYYALRPFFPVAFRRILQGYALQNWEKIPFPNFPLDSTVEDFVGQLWTLMLKVSGESRIPFVWYWPKGYQSCGIMTHDVETGAGQDFCFRLLEIEREAGIKSSFELVPEERYNMSDKVIDAIRSAGSEVCIHGLNHDGKLFSSEQEFRRRAKKINAYAKEVGATGFRSPVMYRNVDWYDALEFSYDMSLPNVGHLDPQRGGCLTVFPFFIGDIVELPLTTIQDYPLFNILKSDPLDMWSKQLELISARNGLASFIVHPDYIIEQERQKIYSDLLAMLRKYHDERQMWLALPREVDRWWRQREAMSLENQCGQWVIRGEGAERAQIAYATLKDGQLHFVTDI